MATLVYYRMQQLSRGFRTLWGSKYRKLKAERGSPDIDSIAKWTGNWRAQSNEIIVRGQNKTLFQKRKHIRMSETET